MKSFHVSSHSTKFLNPIHTSLAGILEPHVLQSTLFLVTFIHHIDCQWKRSDLLSCVFITIEARKAVMLRSNGIWSQIITNCSIPKFSRILSTAKATAKKLDVSKLVVFEDKYLLVIAKPPGLLTQGDFRNETNLYDEAKNYIKESEHKTGKDFLTFHLFQSFYE